jgi:hypothetical protein
MTTPYTPKEFEKLTQALDDGMPVSMITDSDVRRLLATIEDRDMEIARHHKDFSRWEATADKGAQQLAKARAWDELYSRYGQLSLTSNGLSINPLVGGVVKEMEAIFQKAHGDAPSCSHLMPVGARTAGDELISWKCVRCGEWIRE